MLSVTEITYFRQIQKQLEDARQANDILSSEHDKTLAELEAAMKVGSFENGMPYLLTMKILGILSP